MTKDKILPKLKVVASVSETTILDEIQTAAVESSFVLIDLEGAGSRRVGYAISQSDFVVIPIKEQHQDAEAGRDMIAEIKREEQALRRKVPFAILITQSKVVAKSRTERHIASLFANAEGVDVFDTEIHSRDAFSAIFSVGLPLQALDDPSVSNLTKAVNNARLFAQELIEQLKLVSANQPTQTTQTISNIRS